MGQYSVVIADDHQIVRDGLADMLSMAQNKLEIELTLKGQATNGLEALTMVRQHRPDLLFLDISMPLASGSEIIADVKRWSPDTKILVFTGIVAPGLLASLVQAGVHGLFSKSDATASVLEVLPVILNGGHHIASSLLALIEQGQQTQTLTDRERQTLNMILSGKSNKEIARVLSISVKTVEKHRTSLMQKLDVHSVAELMARALQDGLIDGASSL
ncbi:MAG: LuxR C-terminal-related transcriptional regulator [Pseudomonadales bacterium]